MGKSSLMVRTAARLDAAGATVAALDFTAIGQNVSAEQWYDGLLSHLGRRLDLEDDLDEFWFEHQRLGPLQLNIGRRIELTDFTAAEAAPLAGGLGPDEPMAARLLERVLYWTGGHPHLTQRLCQAVAAEESVADVAGVDRLCEALFLSPQAQEQDDNLLFVRERLLRPGTREVAGADVAGLLALYATVRQGKRVRTDDTNQLVSLLRLSGITRVSDGCLRVRNRIYERVFDSAWIMVHMPDAELRRQQSAYHRGLARAAAVSAVIVAVMAGLALTAVNQAHRAEQQRQLAEVNLYVANMNLAQQTWESGNVGRALALVEAHRPHGGQEDLRGFEWPRGPAPHNAPSAPPPLAPLPGQQPLDLARAYRLGLIRGVLPGWEDPCLRQPG
jgi:hypothetical protein